MVSRLGYDLAIVGGGAAGCVLAARLALAGTRSVVLVEGGPDARSTLPDEMRDGWHLSRLHDWGYESEPDERGATSPVRRGRLLGGTSWMTRFAVRGSPADFDDWVALGNPGWGFDQVLPYFARLETDVDYGDRPWHGADGPIPVNRYLDLKQTEALAASAAAAEAAGFPTVEDHNEPGAVGIGRMPMSSVNGVRVTATAFLDAVRERDNLEIRPESPVDRVIVDGERVTGVRLADGTVIAARTVVLSAGTYGSPAILMRSGIGPAAHLRTLGIDIHRDLPGVGANLADHPGVDVDTDYAGPGRSTPLLHSIGTFHSHAANSNSAPDLLLWLSDPDDPDSGPQMPISAVLMKPEARGSVRLRSADPSDAPVIVLPGVSASDVMRLAEGFERALDVAMQPVLRRLAGTDRARKPPTRGELLAAIRENVFSVPHVVGTCRMGPSPANGAVVDAGGRVHGIDGLFVADASIIPTPPSGFPHIPTLMIAERLAEVIAAS